MCMIFQKNKMAAIIQNGRRWAQHDNSGGLLTSKLGQVSPIWLKHDTNMSHYPITKMMG